MAQRKSEYQEADSPESMKREETGSIVYTHSVKSVQSEIGEDVIVTSMDLIQVLARLHPEYASGKFEKAAYDSYAERAFATKPAGQWFRDTEQLFNPNRVPELHGRLLALGLCELDPELKIVFENSGVYQALQEELKENFESLLAKGRTGDPAVLHLDSDTDTDHLGRDGFVEALATWLNRFWKESNPNEKKEKGNSFMVHLHGPWGSGKSTLLNLLEQKLTQPEKKEKQKNETNRDQTKKQEKENKQGQTKKQEKEQDSDLKWVVIRFNAWQHSHVEPVWWPLLNQFYKGTLENLKKQKNNKEGRITNSRKKALSVWWYDFRWKLISGNKSTGYWFLLFLVLLVLLSITKSSNGDSGSEFIFNSDTPKAFVDMVALAGTIVTGFFYFFRSLIWGSAGSAQVYLKLNQDPLEKIKEYFREVVKRIDQPVMIYIDDLDRCPSGYVVDLLESLQTLFNDSRVFYVLAADRRWLYGSFEERYEEFRTHIEEPGKQIGYLFLDKLFQLSISVPQVSPQIRENYLNYLYLGEEYAREQLEEYRRQAREEFEKVTVESELIGKAGSGSGDSTKDQIRREEAVRVSAKVEIEAGTEYFLRQFAQLLEPNPRSIKRLVNNYGIYRAIVMLSDLTVIDTEEKRKKFALWNIVAMRWPLLAEYLEEERNQIPFVLNGDTEQIEHEKIKELAALQELQNVLQGKGVGTSLDADYVKQILNLQAAPA